MVGVDRYISAEVKNVLAFGEGRAEDASLEGYAPLDPDHFGLSAQVFIGDTARNHSDSFDITVCSPAWFAAQVAAGEWERFRSGGLRALPGAVAPGHGLWFMHRWDRTVFEEALTVVCDSFSPGPDWGSVASRIGRLIPWESDYKYDQHVDQHPGPPFPP
jgi:Immunity protein 8